MMSKSYLKACIYVICAFCIHALNAQTRPFVTGFSPASAAPGEEVIISGYNLPTANIRVTIGGVEASVTGTPTTSTITIIVPANAAYEVITVQNKSNGLSGCSSKKLLSSFGGSDFDNALISETSINSSQTNLYDIATADFDGDNKVDIVSTDLDGTNISIFLNTGTVETPSFSLSTTQNNQNFRNLHVVSGDLDGDGKEDLVTTQGGSSNNNFYTFRNSSVLGAISFEVATNVMLPSIFNPTDTTIRSTKRVVIKDIDGDGKKDIIVNSTTDGTIFIYPNISSPGAISLDNPIRISASAANLDEISFWGLEAKDLNADGLPELVLSDNRTGGRLYIFQNKSRTGVFQFFNELTLSTVAEPLNLKVGDLNNDGLDDIVVTDRRNGELGVHVNTSNLRTGEISFSALQAFEVNSGVSDPWGIEFGDINGDGKADIITTDNIANNYNIFINNSDNTNIILVNNRLSASTNSRNLKVVDIDSNGKPEILLAGKTSQNLIIINNLLCQSPKLDELSADLTKLCGGTAQTIGVSPIPGTTYSWESSPLLSDPVFTPTGDITASVTVSTEGIYRIISNSAMSCADTSNTIRFTGGVGTVPAMPAIIAPAGDICQGDIVSLSVNAVSGISHIWKKPDETEIDGEILNLGAITAEQSGQYAVFAVDNTTFCRSDPGTADIAVTSIPQITISTQEGPLFCEDVTVSIETQNYPVFDYSWLTNDVANGSTSKTIFEASSTGNYRLVVSDAPTGCADTSNTISLRALIKPIVNIVSEDESCISTETQFSGTVVSRESDMTLNLSWDFKDGNTSTLLAPSNAYTSSGDFSPSLTSSYAELGSCQNTVTKNLKISEIPTSKIELLDLDGKPATNAKCPADSISLSFPTGLIGYAWTIVGTSDTISRNNPAIVVAANTYAVSATNSINCIIVDQVEIRDLDNSGIDIIYNSREVNDDTITLEQDDIIVSLSAERGTDYEWGPAELFDNADKESTRVYPRKDTNITLKGLDTNGCIDSVGLFINDTRILEEKALSLSGFNGDNCWEISNTASLSECSIYIFDNKGKNILVEAFSSLPDNSEDCVWAGTAEGVQVKPGIYYYVIKCPGNQRSSSGSIVVVE